MASNTPAVRIPRQFYSAPRLPHAGGGSNFARAYEGSGGRNPLASAKDDSGQGDYIAPPIHVGGLIGLGLDPARDKEYEQRVNARDAARQEKIQAGIDAYGQALDKTGDPRAALIQTFHPDNEGHVHFADKETFSKILELHNAALAGQPLGNWQTQDLGNGLVGVTDPNQKTSVHAAGAGSGRGLTTGFRVDPQTGMQIPIVIDKNSGTSRDVQTQGGGTAVRKQAGPAKPLTANDEQELNGIERVMPAMDLLHQNAGAAGAFGLTTASRLLGHATSFDTPQARALDQSLDQAHASITQAMGGSTRLSHQYQQIQNLLPGAMSSEENVREGIATVNQTMRQSIAGLYNQFQHEGKDTSRLDTLAERYNAHPDYMKWYGDQLHQLRTDPTKVSNNDLVQMYAGETFHPDQSFAMGKTDAMNVMGEMERRNLWNARNDIVKAYPDRAYLPDQNSFQKRYASDLAQHASKYGPTPATQAVQQQQQATQAATQPQQQNPLAQQAPQPTAPPPVQTPEPGMPGDRSMPSD